MHKGSTALTARACQHARGLERDSPTTGQPEALLGRPRGECPLSATDIRFLILDIRVAAARCTEYPGVTGTCGQHNVIDPRTYGEKKAVPQPKRRSSNAGPVQSQESVPRCSDCPLPPRYDCRKMMTASHAPGGPGGGAPYRQRGYDCGCHQSVHPVTADFQVLGPGLKRSQGTALARVQEPSRSPPYLCQKPSSQRCNSGILGCDFCITGNRIIFGRPCGA